MLHLFIVSLRVNNCPLAQMILMTICGLWKFIFYLYASCTCPLHWHCLLRRLVQSQTWFCLVFVSSFKWTFSRLTFISHSPLQSLHFLHKQPSAFDSSNEHFPFSGVVVFSCRRPAWRVSTLPSCTWASTVRLISWSSRSRCHFLWLPRNRAQLRTQRCPLQSPKLPAMASGAGASKSDKSFFY